MSHSTRWGRAWMIWVGGILAPLVAIITVAFVLVSSRAGSRRLVNWLVPTFAPEVTFERFDGTLSDTFELSGLEYSRGGLRVRAEKLRVRWQPWAMWHRSIQLDSVRVMGALAVWHEDSAVTELAPQAAVANSSSESATGWNVRCAAFAVSKAVVQGPYGITLHDLEVQGGGEPASYRVKLTAQADWDTVSGLRLTLIGQGNQDGMRVEELSLGRDSSRLNLDGELRWEPEVSWDMRLSAMQIDPSAWAPELGHLHGNVNFSGTSAGRMTGSNPEFSVVMDTLQGTLVGTPVSGRVAVRVRDQRLEVDSSRIEWSGLKASANGVFGDSTDLAWELSVSDLSLLYDSAAGELVSQGRAQGALDSLQVTAEVAGRNLALGESRATALAGSVAWMRGGAQPSRCGLLARQVEAGGMTFDSVQFDAAGTRTKHVGTLTLTGSQIDAELALTGSYDSLWQATLDSLRISEAQAGTWRLSTPAQLRVDKDDLAMTDFCLENGEEQICLSGGYHSHRQWSLHGKLSNVSWQWLSPLMEPAFALDTHLDAELLVNCDEESGIGASAQVSISPGRLVYGVSVEDTLVTEACSGQLDWTSDRGHLSAVGGFGSAPDSSHFALELELPGSNLMEDSWSGDSLDWARLPWSGTIAVEPLALSRLHRFLPDNTQIEGQASIKASALSHSGGRIDGSCTVGLSPGQLILTPEHDTLVLSWSEFLLDIRADSAGVAARAAAELFAPSQSVGKLDVDLRSLVPLDLAHGVLDMPVEGSVRAHFDLAALQPFVKKLSGLKGNLDLNSSLRGTPRDLGVEGSLDLSAEAFVQELGIQLSDLRLSMQSSEGTTSVSGGARSGDGSLTLSGSLSRLPSRDAPSRLRLQGENFLAFESREASIWISPDLELVTSGDSMDLSGMVTVPKARIEVQKLPEQAVSRSPDVTIVGDTLPKVGPNLPIWARIKLVLGDDVFFKGFDLTSYLNGSIQSRMQPGREMEARGELVLREGRYRGYGQDLVVDPGRLAFSGPVTDPAIDVLAYRRASDHTKAGFKITGTLKSRRMDLYSEPPRSESDIMSYVLFGRAASEGSESERMRASEAAALLGGNLLAGQAASHIGLDEARIDPGSSNNDASLVAGKYVSPQLFVGYGTGLFESLHTLRVRYIVSEHISLQAETGTRETADVLYQIERGD